jgi:hypothetical protein
MKREAGEDTSISSEWEQRCLLSEEPVGTEELRYIGRVGYYSTSQLDPTDCKGCGDARWATVIVGDLCLDCRDKAIIRKTMVAVVDELREFALTHVNIVEAADHIKRLMED